MENGFQVNTEIRVKPRKRKTRRIIKSPILMGTAVIIALALLAVLFCTFIPVCKVTILDNCVIDANNDYVETNYYDNDGNIIRTEYTYMEMENGYTVFTYDNDGNILKEETFFQNTLVTKNNYIYKEGKLAKKETLDSQNKVNGTIEYFYNTDGTVTMELSYDQEGNITTQYNHTYSGGVKKETTILYLDNNYTAKIVYTYENGNLVTETSTSQNGETVTEYTYDNSGNILTRNIKGGQYAVYRYNYKTVKVPVFSK